MTPNDKFIECLREIHELSSEEEPARVKELWKNAHNIVANSDLPYRDIYCLIKKYTLSQEEFNLVMGRIRKTVLLRDMQKEEPNQKSEING